MGKTADSLSWELSWKKDEATGESKPAPGTETKPGELPKAGIPDFDSLMKKMGKSGGQESAKEVIDLNEAVTDNKGDTAYSAIASRLAMVKMPPAAVSPVQVITPAPGTPVNNINVPGAAAPVVNVDNTDYAGKDKTEVLQGIAENVSGIRSILGGGLVLPVSPVTGKPEAGRNKTVYLRGIYDSVIRLQGIAAAIAAVVTVGGMNPVNPVAIPVVTQISMPEVPAATTTDIPVLAAAPELPRTERRQDKETTPGNKPVMYLDKYCEQVVINIQNTDRRGTDEIRETIRETLTDIFDPYEA